MNRFECNVDALKVPAVILLVTTLASSGLVWLSKAYRVEHETIRQQVMIDLNNARDEYRLAVEAERFLNTSQKRYLQLEQRGFVGDEPRLNWIEALRNSGRNQHLYTLQYDLKQRQPLQLAGPELNQHYRIYGSFMRLDLELAHEVDLLRYFKDLERDRPAVWTLRGCTLSSMALDSRIAFDKPNIKASCELAWYTVKPYSEELQAEESL